MRTTIVIKTSDTGADPIADNIAAQLADHPRINMRQKTPVGLSAALEEIGRDPDIIVAVLICLGPEMTATLARLRERQPNLAVVCLPFDGVPTLTLPNPGQTEIIEIVSTLLNLDMPRDGGKLFVFPARKASASRALAVAEDAPGERVLPLIEAGIEWVDHATRGLLDLWNVDPESAPGFTLTWDSLTSWIRQFVGIANAPTFLVDKAYEAFLAALDDPAAQQTPLGRIAALLERDRLSIQLLLIILSAELDIRFHRLFGAMHDDMGRRQPSVALACAILAAATAGARPFEIRIALSGLERLRAMGLIEGMDEALAEADAPLHIAAPVLDWLLSGDDGRLVGVAGAHSLVRPVNEAAVELLSPDRRATVAAVMRRSVVARTGFDAVLVTGSESGWLDADAAATVENPVFIRLDARSASHSVAAAVHAARLSGRRLLVSLAGDVDVSDWSIFAALLPDLDEPPLILADNAAAVLGLVPAVPMAVADLPPPSNADRRFAVAAVMASLPGAVADEALVAEIADRFRLPLDRIPDAVVLARAAAADARHALPDATDWRAGFRGASGARLPALARRVQPLPCPDPDCVETCLERVVLPKAQRDQLRAILDHVRYGRLVLDDWGFGALLNARGVSALFSGASGTGKTLAAQAIASALGSDLYIVDLARIVSKYIGETEKNLHSVFEEAERAGAVLLFDEADALFGKRSAVRDAHDRYANIEVAYLLQRMELFDGLAILTTNHPENIDQAFARRLRFSVDFPRPDAGARRAIWDISIPQGPHRDPDLDLGFLARRLDLTGGNIRQIALHAAMAAARDDAPISQGHVQEATRSELLRMGAFSELSALEERAA